MKRIALRFRVANSMCWLRGVKAILSVLLTAGLALDTSTTASATTRPRYGSTLRIEIRARVDALDPREIPDNSVAAASTEKLISLVFEKLVRLDITGRPQPQLAHSWQADAGKRRWEFRLRPNEKFHDGTPLAPASVVAALQHQLGNEFLMSVSGDMLVMESKQPIPDLLERLASSRSYIFKILRDGTLAGTGPFRVVGWQPRQRAVFAANDGHWGGRPFLDKIEVQMGVNLAEQIVDFELGKADLIELAPDQLRRATQDGARIWISSPVELLAIVTPGEVQPALDARILQALAHAVDRAAIQSVLLQKQGEVAGGLLPQWVSGYAFLFVAAADVDRARKLIAEISPAPVPLVLEYDAADSIARTVAERVALDASQVGLKLQVAAAVPGSPAGGRLRLVRARLGSLRPRDLLADLAEAFSLGNGREGQEAVTPEEQYAAEKKMLDSYRVVPLVHVPEICGLSPLLRNWMPTRWGEWRLEDAWLALPEQPSAAGGKP